MLFHISLDCLDHENMYNGNKYDNNFCTLIKKKRSIIDTGKRSTPALVVQWLFYLVFRTDQYYHNVINFADSK